MRRQHWHHLIDAVFAVTNELGHLTDKCEDDVRKLSEGEGTITERERPFNLKKVCECGRARQQ